VKVFNVSFILGEYEVFYFLRVPKIVFLKKAMATHSSIPAWKIPWAEEPGVLQSVELQRVRQDSATE